MFLIVNFIRNYKFSLIVYKFTQQTRRTRNSDRYRTLSHGHKHIISQTTFTHTNHKSTKNIQVACAHSFTFQ